MELRWTYVPAIGMVYKENLKIKNKEIMTKKHAPKRVSINGEEFIGIADWAIYNEKYKSLILCLGIHLEETENLVKEYNEYWELFKSIKVAWSLWNSELHKSG